MSTLRRASALTLPVLTALALGCQDGEPVGPATSIIPAAQAATVSLTATLANGQATGCIRSANGTLYNFASGDTPSSPCRGSDVQIHIGPTPSAWAGIEGVLSPSSQENMPPGGSVVIETTASCPEGKIGISGGYKVFSSLPIEVHVLENAPSVQTDGRRGFWDTTVRVNNLDDQNDGLALLFATIACVNAP